MKRKFKPLSVPPFLHITGEQLEPDEIERMANTILDRWNTGRPLVIYSGPDVTITPIRMVSPKRARFLRPARAPKCPNCAGHGHTYTRNAAGEITGSKICALCEKKPNHE